MVEKFTCLEYPVEKHVSFVGDVRVTNKVLLEGSDYFFDTCLVSWIFELKRAENSVRRKTDAGQQHSRTFLARHFA